MDIEDIIGGTFLFLIVAALISVVVALVFHPHTEAAGAIRTFRSSTGVRYDEICINGVTYYEPSHGITVALDKDSKIVPCEEK